MTLPEVWPPMLTNRDQNQCHLHHLKGVWQWIQNTEHLRAAHSRTLTVPWLSDKKLGEDANYNPVTVSSDHYALYDRFHDSNSKGVRDSLRKSSELAGRVNTQAAEQLFAGMRKNNYFLNVMSPTTHMFLVRNVWHIQKTNQC